MVVIVSAEPSMPVFGLVGVSRYFAGMVSEWVRERSRDLS